MSIPDTVRIALIVRSRGKCECKGAGCAHHAPGSGCPNALIPGKWKAHWIDSEEPETIDNLIALCSVCQKNSLPNGPR
jgi:hypothetical protein